MEGRGAMKRGTQNMHACMHAHQLHGHDATFKPPTPPDTPRDRPATHHPRVPRRPKLLGAAAVDLHKRRQQTLRAAAGLLERVSAARGAAALGGQVGQALRREGQEGHQVGALADEEAVPCALWRVHGDVCECVRAWGWAGGRVGRRWQLLRFRSLRFASQEPEVPACSSSPAAPSLTVLTAAARATSCSRCRSRGRSLRTASMQLSSSSCKEGAQVQTKG